MELGFALWLGFLAVGFLQAAWWTFFLIQLWRLKKGQGEFSKTPSQPVSVIIAARNEAENLLTNLPKWLKLLRSEDQLVVINDRSSDDTGLVLHAFQERYSQIKIVTVNELPSRAITFGKKFALTLGIKAAQHEHLLFTDADCEPGDDRWLEHFACALETNPLVLGNGFVKRDEHFVSELAHFDSLHTAILFQSFAKMGIPYMGVGRSMAYHRALFHSQGGFQKHRSIKSGDDDLFVSSMDRVDVTSKPEALTWTNAPRSFAAYFSQRTRHSTTSFHYKWFHKLLLGLYYVSLGFFWPMFSIVLCLGYSLSALVIVIIRLNLLLGSLYLLGRVNKQKLSPFRIVWNDLILAHLYPLFTMAAKWRKSDQWKE